MHWFVAVVLGLLIVPRPVSARDDPYRVTVDVGDSIRLLASEDPFDREPAEILLSSLGQSALPALRAALEKEDEATRIGVVEVLGSSDAEGVGSVLLERAQKDSSVGVRVAAINVLISRDDPEAAEVVPDALASDDPRFYRAAFGGCGKYCVSVEQLDRIVDFVFTEPLVSINGPRGALVRAMSVPSQRDAVLAAIERTAGPRLEEGDVDRRLRAAMLFSDFDDPRATSTLLLALDHDVPTMLRLQSIVALGRLGDADTAEQIGAALDSMPAGLRPAGCKALLILAGRGVAGAQAQARERGCPGSK